MLFLLYFFRIIIINIIVTTEFVMIVIIIIIQLLIFYFIIKLWINFIYSINIYNVSISATEPVPLHKVLVVDPLCDQNVENVFAVEKSASILELL